jgi:hypothetical protein
MKIEKQKSGLYYATLKDGRRMHVTSEVAIEMLTLQKENEELRGLILKISKCKIERINPDEYMVTIPDNLMIFGVEALKQKKGIRSDSRFR